MTIKTNDAGLIYNDSISENEHQQETPTQPMKSSSANHSASPSESPSHVAENAVAPNNDLPETLAKESGGQAGLDPTRYGDWEKKGRCTDF